MGSDTCGSIRIPAANNNLVGLRGTQGLSSRTGIVPLSSTQDIGRPIARSSPDLVLLLDIVVGADPNDPQTIAARRGQDADSGSQRRRTYRDALRREALSGARIGVVRSLFGSAPEDQEVTTIIKTTLDALKEPPRRSATSRFPVWRISCGTAR